MSKNLLLLSSIAAISIALSSGVGCSAPPSATRDSSKKAATPQKEQQTTRVYYAPASKATTAKLGITRWHMTMERDGGGAVVIDGSDANGVVKFSTVMRQDKANHVFRIDSYKQKGSLAIDTRTKRVVEGSLDLATWSKHSDAFAADWKTFSASAAYGLFSDLADYARKGADIAGYVGDIAKGVAWIASRIPGGQAVAIEAAKIAVIAQGVETVLDKGAQVLDALDQVFPNAGGGGGGGKSDDGAASPSADQNSGAAGGESNSNGDGTGTTGSTDGKESSGGADGAGSEAGGNVGNTEGSGSEASGNAGAADGANTGASADVEASAGAESETGVAGSEANGGVDGSQNAGDNTTGQGDALPMDNADSNLDSSSASNDQGESAGAESGGDTGGGETGGGEAGESAGEAGGDAYAVHKKCRAVSCSKSTKVCICKRY